MVGSTIQITTLPLPVLSTLQASGLVFNTICATLILGEPFTRVSLIGTMLVAGGAILIAMFGALPEPSHTLNQLLSLLGRPQFILWMVSTGLAMAGIWIMAVVSSRVPPHLKNTPRIRLLRGMSYGSISAILSAHSLLVAKSAVELIVRTITDRRNQFNRWQSWVILLSLVILALSQLYFLHRGLKLVSTSILYPFVFCIYNITAIIDGLIYFHQADRLPPLHAVLVALGTLVLLSGVLGLSWRLDDEHSTAPPPDTQNLLTPGMGIVEDTTTEDSYGESTASPSVIGSGDEEAAIHNDERSPLLENGLATTSAPKDSAGMQVGRQRLQRFGADADEIWAVLHDEREARALCQGRSGRRARTMTNVPGDGARSNDGDPEGDDGASSTKTKALRRTRTVAVANPGEAQCDGKRWRDRRRRRWSSRYRSASLPLWQQRRASLPLWSQNAAPSHTNSIAERFVNWIRGNGGSDGIKIDPEANGRGSEGH